MEAQETQWVSLILALSFTGEEQCRCVVMAAVTV